MSRIVVPVLVLISIAACGGTDFSTAEGSSGRTSSGSGGATSGGFTSHEGGAVTTTEPAADCATLEKTYLTALELARVCSTARGNEACNADWVLPGACNCSVLVDAQSEAYDAAKRHYDAFIQAGCTVEPCPTVDCAAAPGEGSVPTCKAGGAGTNLMTCQW